MIRMWIILSFSVLIGAVALLQREVTGLQARLVASENRAVEAIDKLEKALAIQAAVAHNTAAAQDAARRAVIDQGAVGLPMGSFRKPFYWDETVDPQHKHNPTAYGFPPQ